MIKVKNNTGLTVKLLGGYKVKPYAYKAITHPSDDLISQIKMLASYGDLTIVYYKVSAS